MPDYGSTVYEPGAFAVHYGGWTSDSLNTLPDGREPDEDQDGDGWSIDDGDCDDTRDDINPDAAEGCEDRQDQDCDGFATTCSLVGDETLTQPFKMLEESSSRGGGWAAAGDLDGDGWDDLIIGDPYLDEIYLALGPMPTGCSLPGDTLMTVLSVGSGGEQIGNEVSALDDGDGDGLPEVVVGASSYDIVYVLGSTDGYDSDRDFDTVRWSVSGSAGEKLGSLLRNVGDLDGDGVGALAIAEASSSAGGSGAGAVHVFDADLAAGSYPTADATLSIVGETTGHYLGSGLHELGDLDGDGLAELAFVNARTATADQETSYILMGDAANTGTITASDADIRVARGTSGGSGGMPYRPGDLDGDGADDVALAVYSGGSDLGGSGTVYLWSGLPASDDSELDDADMQFQSDTSLEYFGNSVADDIDLNGDGVEDLVVGAPESALGSPDGQVYFWYGPLAFSGVVASSASDARLDPSTLYNHLGEDLVSAGDVDADGYEDLWIGAQYGPILWPGGPME